MFKKLFQRLLSLVLVSCMLIQLFPMSLNAEQINESSEETVSEQTQLKELDEEVKNLETIEELDVTPTPDPTVIPDVTPTLDPTATPDVTPTLDPTTTPDATLTLEATATLEPTATPDASATPDATATPEPTDEPIEVDEDGISYLFFGSNYNSEETALTGLLTRIEKDAGYEAIDYVGLTGGFVMESTDSVLSEVTCTHERLSATTVGLLTSDVDSAWEDGNGLLKATSGLLYEGEHVYVYGVTEDSITNGTSAMPDANEFEQWANATTTDRSKVIVVLAEIPWHVAVGKLSTTKNLSGITWNETLNRVAGENVNRDIVVIFGDSTEDVYFPVGSLMNVQDWNTTLTSEIKYTYVSGGDLSADSAVLFGADEEYVWMYKYAAGEEGTEFLGEIKRPRSQTFECFDGYVGENVYATTTATKMDVEDVFKDVNDMMSSKMDGDGYIAYQVDFEGYTAGTEIEFKFPVPVGVSSINFGVYMIHGDDSVTEITDFSYSDGYVTFTANNTGTFVYGIKKVEIPEGAELVDFSIVTEPKNRNVLLEGNGVNLDLDGLVAVATFSNGEETVTKEIDWAGKSGDRTLGYVESYDHTLIGKKQEVELSYEYNGVVLTDHFPIWIYLGKVTDESGEVGFEFSDSGVTDVTVEEIVNDKFVERALNGILSNYVVYDITVKGFMQGNIATVTLPIPEDVENPAVFYVNEKTGSLENMNCEIKAVDGTVVFKTSHFSTYAVGEAEIDIESKLAVVETKVPVKKTVWKLVDTVADNKSYLIVNGNSSGSDYYALAKKIEYDYWGSVGYSPDKQLVTIYQDDAIGTYIEPDDTTYIEWVKNEEEFKNEDQYLRRSSNNSLRVGDDSRNTWTYTTNQLSYVDKNKTYYLRFNFNNNQWGLSTTSSNVYFYEETEVEYFITTSVTYGIEIAEGSEGMITVPNIKDKTIPLSVTYTADSQNAENPGGTPEWSVVDGNDIVEINESTGVMTLTGAAGRAVVKVKQVVEGKEMTNFLIVDVVTPKSLVLEDKETGNPVEDRIVVKSVTAETKKQLVPTFYDEYGIEMTDVDLSKVVWTWSNESVATVDANGVVTFKGVDGTVEITASYVNGYGETIRDRVTFSATVTSFTVPSDGTDDFPEYPNEGAIRFDKHAQAVGNFSDTGVVQVELSMTGVPYTTGNEIDVVIMLDMSTSMVDGDIDRKTPTITAAQEALRILVQNEDKSFNGNRVAIYGFNGWHNSGYNDSANDYNNNHIEEVYEYDPKNNGQEKPNNYNISRIAKLQSYNQSTFDTTWNSIESNYTLEAGTNYAAALRQAYLTLENTKEEGRDQYLIFMTDGFASTGFSYKDGNSYKTLVSYTTNYRGDATYELGTDGLNGIKNYDLHNKTEYYSYLMKNNGVEIFTVGFQVGAGINGVRNEDIQNGKTVLKNIAGTSAGNATTEDYADHAMFIEVDDNPAKIVEIFKDIAQSIKQAATNVLVTDKIADKYTMIFDFPDLHDANDFPTGQEFYIEVLDYKLEAVTDANGNITDYVRTGNPVSLSKLYLKQDQNGDFYAASNNQGTRFSGLVFEQVQSNAEEKIYGYWSRVDSSSDADVTVDGLNYKFMPMGDGDYNIKSGAYVSGNDSQNIKIITPYFIYDASTRILLWTSQKLSSSELALSYFLYLDKSAGWETLPEQTDPGTYMTNDYATIRYENHLGNTCQQEFPVPQMTWHGAQVSYVFYLVNEAGQPVNRAGQVVPFSEAIYVTDVFTKSVVWNKLEKTTSLESELLARDLLPDVYELFDHTAAYQIHVFEDEKGMDLNNHFMIVGDPSVVNTTYVFNTKSGKKFNTLGIYSAKKPILCKDYNVTATPQVDSEGNQVYTFVYNGDVSNQYKDPVHNNYIYEVEVNEDGTKDFYTIVYRSDTTEVTGVDFANTTVAFAVKWKPKLAQDTIVIDYGLPVSINVALNDNLSSTVKGVLSEAPNNVNIDEGTYNKGNNEFFNHVNTSFGYATVENNTSVLYTLTDMTINTYDRFYYESGVSYYEGNVMRETNMYSSVTVIPATSIYYEDSFVKFDGYAATGEFDDAGAPIYSDESKGGWTSVGTLTNAIQQTDRPGPDKIGTAYDADNVYGYDNAYKECSTYSLGSAMKFTASFQQYGTASFEFYGTGFDVISLTSNTTGTILVDVYSINGSQESLTNTYIVDTYYGYTYNGEWVLDPNDPNVLYQIPVISVEGLDYGKYKAVVSVIYSPNFDHGQGQDSYDFYLDAVRIFDPAADTIEITDPSGATTADDDKTYIKDVYLADGEYKPDYQELRNWIIEANTFDKLQKDATPGIVFIDGIPNLSDSTNGTNTGATDDESLQYWISDYKNFGPNNELYLNAGQAISFDLHADLPEDLSMYDVRVQIGLKSPTGSATYKIAGVVVNDETTADDISKQLAKASSLSVSTATEMYYDITDLNDKTIVIQNTAGMLSVTNIKITAALKEETETASASHGIVNTAIITPLMFGLMTVDAEEELPLFSVNPVSTRKIMWALNGREYSLFEDQKLPFGPDAPEGIVGVVDSTDDLNDLGDLPEIANKRDEHVFELLDPEDFFEKFNVFDAQSDNIFMRILSFIANCFAEFVLWLKQQLGF